MGQEYPPHPCGQSTKRKKRPASAGRFSRFFRREDREKSEQKPEKGKDPFLETKRILVFLEQERRGGQVSVKKLTFRKGKISLAF